MIDQKAREIVAESHSDIQKDAALSGAYDRTPSFRAARLGIIEGLEMAAKALQDDAKLCDCSAWEESECACGAWCEWKTIPSHRAVEIVRALIEEAKA